MIKFVYIVYNIILLFRVLRYMRIMMQNSTKRTGEESGCYLRASSTLIHSKLDILDLVLNLCFTLQVTDQKFLIIIMYATDFHSNSLRECHFVLTFCTCSLHIHFPL